MTRGAPFSFLSGRGSEKDTFFTPFSSSALEDLILGEKKQPFMKERLF